MASICSLGVDRAGGVGRRHEDQGLGARRLGRVELVQRDPEARALVGGQHGGDRTRQPDGLGVGRPVRRRQQDLVAGVEQHLHGVVDRVLAAVGDDDLVGADLVARVAPGLVGDRLLERRHPAGRTVAVVDRIRAGLDGGLDDVVGRGEVGLAGPEADHGLARGTQRLGLVGHREGGRRCDGTDAAGHTGFAGHGTASGAGDCLVRTAHHGCTAAESFHPCVSPWRIHVRDAGGQGYRSGHDFACGHPHSLRPPPRRRPLLRGPVDRAPGGGRRPRRGSRRLSRAPATARTG